jgi:DNA polymerase epsilon subunit 2
MNKATFRRELARACKKQGLLIQPTAMTAWLKEFESGENSAIQVDALLHHLKHLLSQKTGPKLITLPLFQEALEQISSESGTNTGAISKKSRTKHITMETTPSIACNNNSKPISISTSNWRLVSAFHMPKLVYDAMRQQFHYDLNPNKSLMGTAQDLTAMRTQRYSLVKQRVVRHRQQHQLKNLMTIDRLLGSKSMTHVEHVLLGMLRSSPSNLTGCCLELEDLTGSIPLKINLEESAAMKEEEIVTQLDPRGIYMDGSMVLAHGMYLENGVFLCSKLEFPPLESPAQTKQYLPPSPYVDMDLRSSDKNVSLLTLFCMGNLELDDPDCLEQLKNVAERIMFEEDDFSEDGAILALFGNFQTSNLKVSAALEEISKILRECKLPRKHSVLIIPGPQDVAPNGCWPLPALDKHIVPLSLQDMDNVYFCSNPCRLELKCGRSILLVRKDLIQESLQNQILSVDTTDIAKSLPLDRRVLHHMLSQGHIMPASTSTTLQPIYWNFDHAMQLNPLPDLMIVGLDTDYGEEGLEYVRSGCRILAPPCRDHFHNWVKVTLSGEDEVDVEMGQVDSNDEE